VCEPVTFFLVALGLFFTSLLPPLSIGYSLL